MLDCGGRDEDIPEELLGNLSFISPNETELSRVINVEVDGENLDIEMIREKLLNKYEELVVVLKLGSKGSAVLTKDSFIKCDTVTKINPEILNKYKIVDTTGAGVKSPPLLLY